ncbi:S1 family peptidase [Vibrio sp. RC586]|uniref:S1 family peptidase n=1 Tax=Vibrio sp. RC586 TaxID=675815 RepID=UPI00050BF58D|nr:trypsin-like serine protease [Vibrio sp. RC586]
MKKAYTLLACSIMPLFFPAILHAESAASVSPRIINGSDAAIGDWPSIVALVKRNQNAFDGQFCGGSFLGGRYVLTAAHCVEFMDPEKLDVVIGINNLHNENREGIRVPVRRIYVHEDYRNTNLINDIAVLELANEVASPAMVIADAATRASTGAGTRMSVAGWGTTAPSGSAVYPTVLQQVDVELQDQNVCYGAMSPLNPSGMSASEDSTSFCAGTSNNSDSCRGDSGGPLIITSSGVQLGIVSWGSNVCASNGTYGVYTNISYFSDWLAAKTSGFSYQQYINLNPMPLEAFSRTFTYNNFSSSPLTYSMIEGVDNPYAPARVTANGCENQTLNTNESCDITVQFNPQFYLNYEHNIEVSFLENGITYKTAKTTVTYKAMRYADLDVMDALANIPRVDILSSEFAWIGSGSGLRSGFIGDSQNSELVIRGVPRGKLSFDYRMSSENTDRFELYLNGEYQGRASGYAAGSVTLKMLDANNIVEFRYIKDESYAVGEDGVFITNIRYSSNLSTDSSSSSGSSGGGSIGWFGLLLFVPLWMRRKAS